MGDCPPEGCLLQVRWCADRTRPEAYIAERAPGTRDSPYHGASAQVRTPAATARRARISGVKG
jgi:hypothetical protein